MKKQITEDEFEALQDKAILAYAKQASPKELHQMVMEWNWDNADPFLTWLTDNSATDKGTILMIYWRYGPRYYKQFADRETMMREHSHTGDYDLVEAIEQKYISGFYTNEQFVFDPTVADNSGTIWSEEYNDTPLVREIPSIMFEKTRGVIVEEPQDFEEGMPPGLVAALEEIYERYDMEEE